MSGEPNSPKQQLFCSVSMCRNYKNPYSATELYHLPRNEEQRQKFSEILGIPYGVAKKDTTRVCALHFKSKVRKFNNGLLSSENKGLSTVQPIQGANTSNVTTTANATTFSHPNLIYSGQPVRFFLQETGSNTRSSISSPGSSVLKPIRLISSSSLISSDKIVNKPALSLENRNIFLDEDSNIDVDSNKKRTDAQLDLQCDEELLSQSQLNAYYSDLVSFFTANGIVKKNAYVNTATISTQTDPVTILITDQIHPQPSPTSESSILNSILDLHSGSFEIEDEISIIEQSPTTPVIDDASLKINKSSLTERTVQIPHTSVTLASCAPISLPSLEANSYQVTPITATTIPTSTVTTSSSSINKPKCYSYFSPNPTVSKPSIPILKLQVKQPPPYPSSEKPQGNVPLFKQVGSKNKFDSNLTSKSQTRLIPSLSPATSTLVSFPNQSNQLVQSSSGLAIASSTPTGISFQNQVRFEPSLPANQMSTQLQLFSVTDNSSVGTLPIYSNYNATNIVDAPFQFLIQNNNQPNVLYANNFPAQGSSISGFNTSATSSPVLSRAVGNDSDKDADLLGLCNVTAVYGKDTPPHSSTPVDQASASDSNASGDTQQNKTDDSVLDKFGVVNDDDSGSTLSGIESPYISRSDNSENSMGPLIVDVISATEGAKEYYIGDKMPNILLDKGKKDKLDNKKEKGIEKTKMYLTYISGKNAYYVGEKIPNVLFNETKKIEMGENKMCSKDAVVDYASINKNTDGPLETIQLQNNSLFLLQKIIPIIPNGSQTCKDAQTLLSLKIPVERCASDDADILRKRLRAEKYITCSVWWLVRRNYMPMVGPCSCKSHAFRINRSSKHPDGYCWQCANPVCLKEEKIKRPKFFESFQSCKLEYLLLLTYHWACQTAIEDVVKEVDMNYEQIFAYYRALQKLCHRISLKKCKLGLTAGSIVEAGLVKLGKYFVFGAYDRKTGYTRLAAISQLDANSNMYIKLLENWLDKRAILVTDQKVSDECLKGIKKLGALSSVTSPSSKDPHTLNISKYLLSNLTSLFGKVDQSDLLLEDVKGFLYELQWRGKYGKCLDMSFWSIMNHIRDLNDDEEIRITAKPGDLDIHCYSKKMKPILQKNWGTNKVLNRTSAEVVTINSPVKVSSQVQLSTKSYSKTTTQPPSAKKAQYNWLKVSNASEFFQDVPEIPGGSSNINSKSLLAIKIRCEDCTAPGVYKPNAISLGLQLRTEGFISDPVRWLVKKGYMRSTTPCYVCSDTALLKVNLKYKDGCSWLCQNKDCKFENMFRRPLFFARFSELPMAQIAAMIFHWTVQSDYNIVISDVPLESVKISHAWRAFQVLCSSALKRDHFKIGGDGQIVEVAMVQYGKLYILGARHRGTKRTLLKCFPIEMKEQVTLVHETLRNWILIDSQVVINATSSFSLPIVYKQFAADTSITDRASTKLHVLNITSYLLKHIFEMFGHLRADVVKPHLMQVYLDELMWRERYGKLPNLAFSKIMHEIFFYEKHGSIILDHQHVKELLDEEPPTPIIQKEAVVVLQRIPQTVLKYYNCLPIVSSTKESFIETKPYHNSEEFIIGGSASGKEPVSLLTGESKHSVPPDKKKKTLRGSKSKAVSKGTNTSSSESESTDEEWSNSTATVDEVSSSSDGEETLEELISKTEDNLLHNHSRKNYGRSHSVSLNDSPGITEGFLLPKTEIIDDVIPNFPGNNVPDVNSVQPLVIKMNKNNKKFQSYLKSEFLKAKYKKQRRRRFNIRKLKRKKTQKKTNLDVSQAIISDVVVKKEIIEEEPGPSGFGSSVNSSAPSAKSVKRRFAVSRRLETPEKQVCIECGKEVDLDHFMKEFNCTDCTKAVYTTCCGNAFFEHRSAVLFGKCMSRRNRVSHGLHRTRTLSYTVLCPCGFKSKIGNQIASHLVKCLKTSCIIL